MAQRSEKSAHGSIDALWDFDDPAASEQRFRARLAELAGDADLLARLETQTQIARALGLQSRFDDALRVLDEVERTLASVQTSPTADSMEDSGSGVRVRLLLERGRTLNSSGQRRGSAALFEQAWEIASAARHDALAVDAAHMLAIVAESIERAMDWNRRALRLAEHSSDMRARRWRASLHNNMGWSWHDAGEFERARAEFARALALRVEDDSALDVRIARWCLARSLRSLGRAEVALAMHEQTLRESHADAGAVNIANLGYTHEEMAECLRSLGRHDSARPHFQRAWECLRDIAEVRDRQPQRLDRLRACAAVPVTHDSDSERAIQPSIRLNE